MWKFLRGIFGVDEQPDPAPASPRPPSPPQPRPPLEGVAKPEPRVSYSGVRIQGDEPAPPAEEHLLDLMEQRGYLTSADIDPEGCARTGDYFEAEGLAKAGDIDGALAILTRLCSVPNIYKGHYRLLFQLYRQLNKGDLKAGEFQTVRDRVLDMIRMDNEMIETMLIYWSEVQRRKLGPHYFDRDRNLKVSDAKALLTAAETLKDRKAASLAKKLIERFERIRDKAKATAK